MERQYIRSERAHFMCPNMHFGIVVRIAAKYELEKVQRTLKQIVSAHPVLNCVIAQDENNELYYEYKGNSTIFLWYVKENVTFGKTTIELEMKNGIFLRMDY